MDEAESKDMEEKIYFDTNQIYYIRRIADEAEGWEYGDYSWAYQHFKDDPKMINDIEALCYIVALQYQWDLDFSPSNASYNELYKSVGDRAVRTREAWKVFIENQTEEEAKGIASKKEDTTQENFLNFERVSDSLKFIDDTTDKEIIRNFISSGASVLLTSDDDILRHKSKLAKLGIKVMRPYEWINNFLKTTRGNEEAIDFIERILFTLGKPEK